MPPQTQETEAREGIPLAPNPWTPGRGKSSAFQAILVLKLDNGVDVRGAVCYPQLSFGRDIQGAVQEGEMRVSPSFLFWIRPEIVTLVTSKLRCLFPYLEHSGQISPLSFYLFSALSLYKCYIWNTLEAQVI